MNMSANWRMVGYVFLGGALGTILRYLIFELIALQQVYPAAELTAIFLVNMMGSLFLGITARAPVFQTDATKNFWGLGFAGGFTTMSAVSLFVDYQGLTWEFAVMLFGGVFMYGLGFRVGKQLAKEDKL
jgi:fluoride ion exporter CrcB/FEX